MVKEKIELVGSVDVADGVKDRIKGTGIKGMDMEKAKELGLFMRISNLLCAAHSSVMAAYRIYGNAATVINNFGMRKNDIAKAMGNYEKSFMRFVDFWTDYYAHGNAGKEINEETENLYHRIMEWADIPEEWELGEPQRIGKETNSAIKMDMGDDKTLYFHKSNVSTETIGEIEESWCVTKYDVTEHRQTTVNTDMDKASAIMVAKRLSGEDKENVYTASIVQQTMERRVDVTPFKAFKANNTIGKLTKTEK